MRVVYVGPSRAVEIPELGRVFERGVPEDVPDGVGTRLLLQDVWTEHEPPAPPPPAAVVETAARRTAPRRTATTTGAEETR